MHPRLLERPAVVARRLSDAKFFNPGKSGNTYHSPLLDLLVLLSNASHTLSELFFSQFILFPHMSSHVRGSAIPILIYVPAVRHQS